MKRPPKIVYLVTEARTARYYLSGHLQELQRAGYEVTVIASPGPHLQALADETGVEVAAVAMERGMSPRKDAVALRQLIRELRRIGPDAVNASTPKAGLLGMLAAKWCRVPVRIYLLRGLRLETTGGFSRRVLRWCEWIAGRCAHRVVCVSQSLRELVHDEGLIPLTRSCVLHRGSSNGVRAERFAVSDQLKAGAATLRADLGIGESDRVIGFVGRFTRDKGIEELAAAFDRLAGRDPQLHLLLVGEFEAGDPLDPLLMERLKTHPRIHVAGFIADPAACYHAMDVVAFPSYREGFPNVPLEAAAAGKPVVGFAATGTIDAIVDGVTGRLVAPGNVDAFTTAIGDYLANPAKRLSYGRAAAERVRQDFRPEVIWRAWLQLYREMLTNSGSVEGLDSDEQSRLEIEPQTIPSRRAA